MSLVRNKFGARSGPKWSKGDLEAHIRLSEELSTALAVLSVQAHIGVPKRFRNVKWDIDRYSKLSKPERMDYFFKFALRLQRCYVFLMDSLAPVCKAEVTQYRNGNYKIELCLEGKLYFCNYLDDHVNCLTWIVNKINFHVRNSTRNQQ